MSSFQQALTYLKGGGAVNRDGWNGKGLTVVLQRPTEHSKMTRPYFYIAAPKGSTKQFQTLTEKDVEMVPWVPSQTDLLADDWNLLPMMGDN